VRGESLDHLIKRHKGGATLAEAWPTIRDCANALSYMHLHKHKIVHMDFKPGNVFCTEDGETKVLDLGLARSGNETLAVKGKTLSLTAPRSEQPVWLTPEYASCEMFLENHQPDPRDDIYAFGCVAYELLTGRHPFRSSNGSAVWAPNAKKEKMAPARPKGLGRRQWRALQQTLRFDRAERLLNVELFLAEFDPKPRRRPWWILLALPLVVIATIVALNFRPVSADDKFIDDVVRSHPVDGHKPAKAESERGWKDQAKSGLELAQVALNQKQYDDAEYYLDDGPTSVRFSLDRLVKSASTDNVLHEAARSLLELSKLYAIPAAALRTSNAPEALRWACSGLGINPYEEGLRSLYAGIRQTVPGDVPTECESFEQAQRDAVSKP
jgi:serine/threonine protein kinase